MTGAAMAPTASGVANTRTDGDALVFVLSGDWSLDQAPPRVDALVATAASAPPASRRLAFDARQLGTWDSSLLIFLLQCQDYGDAHSLALDTSGLPPQVPRLLTLARAVPERLQQTAPRPASFITRLGTSALRLRDAWLAALNFTGEIAIALTGIATGRVRMRWREFWVVVQTNSSGALGIVTLISLLVGVIIAFLGVVVLKRFGAGYYVSYLVGFGMLREMGALMTGIIIAGRTGAAFAAELGSMKITEEIDAYTTLGISPVAHLVLPRFLGLFVMMPLLTIYADLVGIAGGMFISATMLDLSVRQFMNGMLSAVTLSDALLGVVKGLIFGAIVGIAGCLKGLQAGTDASSVGRAATSAVVLGITYIVAANAVVDWLAALLDA
jgi:phospholipid/cholesterol/gamma-HCH transport system permease protein